MSVDVDTLVALWHGEAGKDTGYRSVWLGLAVARLIKPISDTQLIRKFYPSPVKDEKNPNSAEWQDVPEHAKEILQLAYKAWREQTMELPREEPEAA